MSCGEVDETDQLGEEMLTGWHVTVCAIELGRDAPESTRVHTFTYPPAIMVM